MQGNKGLVLYLEALVISFPQEGLLCHVARRNKANHNAPHVCRDERVQRKCHHVATDWALGLHSPHWLARALMGSVWHKHECVSHQKEPCSHLDVKPVMKGCKIEDGSSVFVSWSSKKKTPHSVLKPLSSLTCLRVSAVISSGVILFCD